MPHDYSKAPPPRNLDLIPHGTICAVIMQIVPGPAGLLWRSTAGDCEMLKVKFTVTDGPYARKQFWENMIIVGTTPGQKQMAETWEGTRKAILESARNIKPKDMSEAAMQARHVESYGDFDGLCFVAKIGVKKGEPKQDGSGNYPDKNVLLEAITPDHKQWHSVEQPPQSPKSSGAAAAPPASGGGQIVQRPEWGR